MKLHPRIVNWACLACFIQEEFSEIFSSSVLCNKDGKEKLKAEVCFCGSCTSVLFYRKWTYLRNQK